MSMLPKTSLLAVAFFVTAAGWAANPESSATGKDQRPTRPPIDTALDADGDEVITAAEIANAAAALAALDRNGDGNLSADECLSRRPRRPSQQETGTAGVGRADTGRRRGAGKGGPKPPIFSALDSNGDGAVSSDELSNAATILGTLDRNGDGGLEPEEYRPPRPAERGSSGGGADRKERDSPGSPS